MFKNLIAEIARSGLTKVLVAEELGINRNTLNLKIKGKTSFTLVEVKKLLTIFKGVKFEYLFLKNK